MQIPDLLDEGGGAKRLDPFRDAGLGVLDPRRRSSGIDADVDEGSGKIAGRR
jgi:hypothetical protein